MIQDNGNIVLDDFQISYEELDGDTLQVDINGQGVVKYEQIITDELLLEINTNINKALTKYSKITGHSAADIGYFFDLRRTKTYNRTHHQGESKISLYIVFKKPVKGASAYSLTPTIKTLSIIILNEIFHIKKTWLTSSS